MSDNMHDPHQEELQRLAEERKKLRETEEADALHKLLLRKEREYEVFGGAMHPLPERAELLIERVEKVLGDRADTLRQEMLAELRAYRQMVRAAMAGWTHGEKNSRMRGLIEVLEQDITALRDLDFNRPGWESSFGASEFTDAWRARRIAQLEREAEELRMQLRIAQESRDDNGGSPF